MATRILLFGLILAGFSSCATYRTGQTPDDVYYSPAREVNSYVQVDKDDDNRLSYNESNLEDRRLRQQIRDSRFRFEDDIYWNTPRYNSWGWNTWNNPYNTWGWNNSWNMNSGWGWNNYNYGYGGYKGWNSGYVCIPGGNNLIIISGPGASRNSTGIRYSAPIQRFTNSGANYNGKGITTGSGSRYFSGNSNSNNGTRRSFFGSGSNNNSSSNWNTNSSSGSSNRTFSSGGSSSSSSGSSSSSSGSNSGSKSTGSSAGGRRN
ncbi:MAG: hypothetical protein IPK31_16390 [Chitinophagaceae bacterium]|nr:hypothetical protein [Chitinophagaceae bacterium]